MMKGWIRPLTAMLRLQLLILFKLFLQSRDDSVELAFVTIEDTEEGLVCQGK
jgi:hypothetical protein